MYGMNINIQQTGVLLSSSIFYVDLPILSKATTFHPNSLLPDMQSRKVQIVVVVVTVSTLTLLLPIEWVSRGPSHWQVFIQCI